MLACAIEQAVLVERARRFVAANADRPAIGIAAQAELHASGVCATRLVDVVMSRTCSRISSISKIRCQPSRKITGLRARADFVGGVGECPFHLAEEHRDLNAQMAEHEIARGGGGHAFAHDAVVAFLHDLDAGLRERLDERRFEHRHLLERDAMNRD